MAKRKSSQKSSAAFRIIMILLVIAAGALYLFTGNDPLELFTELEEIPIGEEQVVEEPVVEEPVVEPAEPVEAAGGGGDWWQVYFTDPATINDSENLAGSIPEKLIALIDSAQQSIHIASFEFNLTPVAEALIRAHERGVDVRWVTDDEHGIEADEEDDHGQFEMLEHAGIEVKDDQRGALMHNKFWIFDGHTTWTGSTNITQNGNFRNNNNVLVIQSTRVAAIYEREFEEMWAGEFGPRSTSTLSQQATTINETPIQILFSAEDEVVSQLVPIIESAEKSIRFMAFSFTHDDLGDAVENRANAGIDVMGIFEKRGSETEYSELPALYCMGVSVRQDGNPRTFHHKVFIIDDEIVITGSLNFSNNANDSNDENVVILANTEIASLYLAEFERRWAEAEDPDPADMACK
ncbi:MAG: phospholipase [Anaerolineales bacterium]|nr:phospholipase [Chloroflexota bacterium]MBL6982607.1 phospholipase [Anaerolineales bacterium]